MTPVKKRIDAIFSSTVVKQLANGNGKRPAVNSFCGTTAGFDE